MTREAVMCSLHCLMLRPGDMRRDVLHLVRPSRDLEQQLEDQAEREEGKEFVKERRMDRRGGCYLSR